MPTGPAVCTPGRVFMRLDFRSRLRARRAARFNLASIRTVKTSQKSAVDNTNAIDTRGCMRSV
jgi:hypothetical protein